MLGRSRTACAGQHFSYTYAKAAVFARTRPIALLPRFWLTQLLQSVTLKCAQRDRRQVSTHSCIDACRHHQLVRVTCPECHTQCICRSDAADRYTRCSTVLFCPAVLSASTTTRRNGCLAFTSFTRRKGLQLTAHASPSTSADTTTPATPFPSSKWRLARTARASIPSQIQLLQILEWQSKQPR